VSNYYSGRRTRNLFDPNSKTPFKLSRSKIDSFLNCPRCFYLDRRLGIGQPPGFPFTLNSAVDKLLKKEFDLHRHRQSKHPIMEAHNIDAVPFKHEKMKCWQNALQGGMEYLHEPTNLLLTGAVDDVWVGAEGRLFIVDYKSTSKEGEVTLDADWQISYKRQMEIYQWLFRRNGFDVSSIGYFLYCNGITERDSFDAKLEFSIKIIPYEGSDAWVEPVVFQMHKCLTSPTIPDYGEQCDFCAYSKALKEVER